MKTSRLATLGLILTATVAPAAIQKPAGPKPAAPVAATPAAPKPAAPVPGKTQAPAPNGKAVAPAPAPAKPLPAPAKALAPSPVAKAAATPVPTPAPAATPDAAAGAAATASNSDFVQSILEQDLEPPRDGYVYNPAGRRDPFISLSKPVTSDEDSAARPRRPGIEGFMLQETTLKGVVKTADGWIVVLEGPDRKAYFVRTGQRLHDGVLTAIDAAGLTFRQEITDPLSPAKSREVRRLLHSAQEESDK